jgi:hypothetical protein
VIRRRLAGGGEHDELRRGRIMNHEKLDEILRLHQLWIIGDREGKRADLSGADLRGADLSGADLSRANLRWADLYRANLYRADLRGADLSRANLRWADLYRANLYRAGYRELGDVVGLVPFITDCLKIYGWEPTCRRLSPGFRQRDERAVLLPSADYAGAFCYVPALNEIWWWAGYCPDPETVTVLWKAE